MLVNLDGMLRNCIRAMKRPKYGEAFMLEQLGKHLHELKRRWKAGDTGVVDEFFALYVIHDEAQAGAEGE